MKKVLMNLTTRLPPRTCPVVEKGKEPLNSNLWEKRQKLN